ncbi:hypothetical protein ACFRKE_09575 [Kitasatospora indigofera]|uniref:hypothetical protein n=1 Tax=Kitasatospora indigofera TaxID=67307 RepID=UPI0036A9DA0D
MATETPPDAVLPDERQPGLYLRTYKVAADGSRHSESALQVADDARGSRLALGSWPACDCPQHRNA